MHTESGTDVQIQSSKKIRSSKEDQNLLKAHILNILRAGYDIASIKILLEVRKDRISGCFMDLVANNHLDFSPFRQILSTKNFRGVQGIENSEYWESCQKHNGEITIKPVSLPELRKNLNLCN